MPVNLFISLYYEFNNERVREIKSSLVKNIALEYIDRIYLFDEGTNILIPDHPKITRIAISQRPTFRFLFSYFIENDINILANNDIHFDKSLCWVRLLWENEVFCLTRREVNGKIFRASYFDSQDVWIVRGKPAIGQMDIEYFMGIPGCDNSLAFEYFKIGYIISNPSKLIKAWHLHGSNLRNYTKQNFIKQPYLKIRSVNLIGLFFTRVLQKFIKKYAILRFNFSAVR